MLLPVSLSTYPHLHSPFPFDLISYLFLSFFQWHTAKTLLSMTHRPMLPFPHSHFPYSASPFSPLHTLPSIPPSPAPDVRPSVCVLRPRMPADGQKCWRAPGQPWAVGGRVNKIEGAEMGREYQYHAPTFSFDAPSGLHSASLSPCLPRPSAPCVLCQSPRENCMFDIL